jgi:hypothetical protein
VVLLEQGQVEARREHASSSPCQASVGSADSFAFVGALGLIDWIWFDGTTGVQLPLLW